MEHYLIKDPEQWVIFSEMDEDKFQANESSPFHYYLVDYQELITDNKICRYKRTIEQINDSSRIEDASLFIFELQEKNHQIVFHTIDIIRDGRRFSVLNDKNISINQRERSLENHITDNKYTISLSIDDLRVGDIIDYQETEIIHAAEHPLHGKSYYSLFWLNWTCPVQLQKVRILNQSKKNITIQHSALIQGEYDVQHTSIEPEQIFKKDYVKLSAMPIENTAPNWLWVNHLMVVTDEQWQNLSSYLYNYYEQQAVFDNNSDPASFIKLTGNTSENIIKVVRFVQNEIRYKGENYGIFSHTPKHSEEILQKRFGDCKDKSNLLVTLLRSLGIDANLTLVSTDYGAKLKGLPPSLFHFNHMIVHVAFQGRDYFFDPTIKKQAGSLENCAQLEYGYGLILLKSGKNLIKLPYDLNSKVFYLKHIFDFSGDENSLTIQREFHVHRADNMRYHFQSTEKNKLASDYLKYAKEETDLDLEIDQAIHIVEDDNERNILRTQEKYLIYNLDNMGQGEQVHLMTSIYRDLPVPTTRTHPLFILLDGKISHDIEVVYPTKPLLQKDEKIINNKWFDYNDIVSTQGNKILFSAQATPRRQTVESKELGVYEKDVEELRLRSMNNFSYELSAAMDDAEVSKVLIYVIIFIVLLAIQFF